MNMIHLKETDSTNDYLKLRGNDFGDRAVVIADKQTGGRGRMNRTFISEPGGLYMSVLIKPFKTELLTVLIGVSAADTIAAVGADPKIKWVNDIFCEGKKVCGILCESCGNYAVAGIGINITNGNLPETAASLFELYGISIRPFELAELIWNKINEYLISSDEKSIIERYRRYSYILGKRITFGTGGEGVAADILDNGNLAVKKDNGDLVILNYGEVSIKLK